MALLCRTISRFNWEGRVNLVSRAFCGGRAVGVATRFTKCMGISASETKVIGTPATANSYIREQTLNSHNTVLPVALRLWLRP